MSSTRFADIVDELTDAVRAIVPVYNPDFSFNSAEDGHGNVAGPFDWMQDPRRRTRDFDIRSTGITYPGPGCNVITEVAVRVAYRADTDLALLDRMINEDALSIYNDVVRNPANWTNANSVWSPEGAAPEAELIEDENGNPATILVEFPLVLDYKRGESQSYYYPRVVSFEDLGGQVARLTMVAHDQHLKTAEEPVTITLRHKIAAVTITPAFVPRTYDTTSAGWTTTGDSITSITTDSSGVAVVDLYYAGMEIGTKIVELDIDNRIVRSELSVAGSLKYLDKNNVNAADAADAGTAIKPYLTLVYALSQTSDENAAIAIVSAATYVEGSIPIISRQAAIVGLADNIFIDPAGSLELRWAGSYGSPRMIRNVETSAGYADTTGTPGDMLFSGCTIVGTTSGILVRDTVWDTFVSGCDLSGTTGAFNCGTDLTTFVYNTTLRETSTIFCAYFSKATNKQWRSRNNTFILGSGWGIGLNDIAQVTDADSVVESDFNTYTVTGGEAGFAYANAGATTYATLAQWQAATGLDTNSTN